MTNDKKLSAWARSAQNWKLPPRCRACNASDDVRDFLKLVLSLKKQGKTYVSLRAISEKIAEEFDVTVGESTIQHHFAVCLKSPWGKQ